MEQLSALISLTQGYEAIVDYSDYDWLMQWKWSLAKRPNTFYAQRGSKTEDGKWKPLLMHSVIIPSPKNMVIDHINCNGLDNRRSNLRLCTKSQNVINSLRKRPGNSKYRGVHYSKDTHLWHAYITINQKRKHIGCFKTEGEAASARDEYEKEYFGDFARLNLLEDKL